jgi:DNA-binding PucR family transcriptional regulator
VVYLLVTDVTAPDPARLTRLATAIAEQSHESLRVGVHAGIGATVRGVEDVLVSRHEADLVLRAIAEQDAPVTVATLDAVNPLVVLLRLRDIVATEPSLLAGKLEILAKLDAKGQTSYLPTLRAYLDALGDIPTAAASLGVHRNTYRYRLRRLVALAGLDMADPVERLVLHLQLHLGSADADRQAGRTPPP